MTKEEILSGLPKNINKIVPEARANSESISKLIKSSGEVTGYELSNGERLTKEEGVQLAKDRGIAGVAIGVSKKGEEYLRSLPDDVESNNLSNLPTVNE